MHRVLKEEKKEEGKIFTLIYTIKDEFHELKEEKTINTELFRGGRAIPCGYPEYNPRVMTS